ncbi:hypothetical protein P3342_013215 [Pyrenophora teres f. teres]|nr:hypothetical protein P3342_013215 [Pyrenophora teres f. teres]
MKRFPNPFHSHRPRPLTTTTTTPAAAPPGPPTPPPSTPTLPSGASSIQNYVCEARRQIEWLQGRLDSAADMGQVNEIKRALKGCIAGWRRCMWSSVRDRARRLGMWCGVRGGRM